METLPELHQYGEEQLVPHIPIQRTSEQIPSRWTLRPGVVPTDPAGPQRVGGDHAG